MDNTAQDFARKIVVELEGIKRLIVDAISRPREERQGADESQHKTDGGKRQSPSPVQSASSESHPSISSNHRSDAVKPARFPKLTEWKPFIDTIGLLTLVTYTGVTIFMWWEARKANRTAQDALMAGQRPWVGLDDENPLDTTPLTIDSHGTITLNYRINAKNFGNYGAQSVFAFAHLVITQDLTDMPFRETKFCRESVSSRIGFVLFPGARTRATSMFPDSVREADRVSHLGSGKEFQAYMIGCVL